MNTAKIYDRVHSRGELWEQPLILHVSPTTSSVVHQATCYQCPNVPEQVLGTVTCSATHGKHVNILQYCL